MPYMSVCFSVQPFVTSHSTEMAKYRVMQTTSYDCSGIPVFWCQRYCWNSNRATKLQEG